MYYIWFHFSYFVLQFVNSLSTSAAFNEHLPHALQRTSSRRRQREALPNCSIIGWKEIVTDVAPSVGNELSLITASPDWHVDGVTLWFVQHIYTYIIYQCILYITRCLHLKVLFNEILTFFSLSSTIAVRPLWKPNVRWANPQT